MSIHFKILLLSLLLLFFGGLKGWKQYCDKCNKRRESYQNLKDGWSFQIYCRPNPPASPIGIDWGDIQTIPSDIQAIPTHQHHIAMNGTNFSVSGYTHAFVITSRIPCRFPIWVFFFSNWKHTYFKSHNGVAENAYLLLFCHTTIDTIGFSLATFPRRMLFAVYRSLMEWPHGIWAAERTDGWSAPCTIHPSTCCTLLNRPETVGYGWSMCEVIFQNGRESRCKINPKIESNLQLRKPVFPL